MGQTAMGRSQHGSTSTSVPPEAGKTVGHHNLAVTLLGRMQPSSHCLGGQWAPLLQPATAPRPSMGGGPRPLPNRRRRYGCHHQRHAVVSGAAPASAEARNGLSPPTPTHGPRRPGPHRQRPQRCHLPPQPHAQSLPSQRGQHAHTAGSCCRSRGEIACVATAKPPELKQQQQGGSSAPTTTTAARCGAQRGLPCAAGTAAGPTGRPPAPESGLDVPASGTPPAGDRGAGEATAK